MLRLRVLGSVAAEREGHPVGLGGPLQQAVLALLVIGRGTPISADRMIDLLWRDGPPARAIASVQAYVSNLRRVLEPGRKPRDPATILVSSPSGYALDLPHDAVDAWGFEAALRQARAARPPEALPLLERALGWWRGPAYAQFADEGWAGAEAARLDGLRLAALEAQAELSIRLGRTAASVALTQVLTREHPTRDEGWRLLALALWASGRQAEALDALRRQAAVARELLGSAPPPSLAELAQAILTGRTDVLHALTESAERPAAPGPAADPRPPGPAPFLGRLPELGALASIGADARGGGRIALVAGEAGIGKTRLLARAAEQLAADDRLVLLGRCPEHNGAPPAWAWVEILRALARHVPPQCPDRVGALLDGRASVAPPRDAATERFLLHRAVGAWIAAAARARPLVLMLDDLHRADAETLALLDHVAGLDGLPLLIVAAHRPNEANRELAETLARLAPREPLRIALGGLPDAAVADLVAAVHAGPADPADVAAIARRTGGNPFYVLECARLLAAEGVSAAVSEVPQGVRDVLRRRISRLPEEAVSMLRLAAVAGTETTVELLVRAAELPEPAALDALERCVEAGMLVEPAPDRVGFAHSLTRDTVYTDLTRVRRGRLHARIASALSDTHPEDATGLSYHCSLAATEQLAPLALSSSLTAADLAEHRHAHDAAARCLARAADALERMPADRAVDRADRLVEVYGRLQRARIRAGRIPAARTARQRAIDVAERSGRDDLLTAALSGWHVPTPWQTRTYGTVDEPVVRALERQLARRDLGPADRCRLLDTLVAELSGADLDRVTAAAREQLALARATGDPHLLAMALESGAKSRAHELHCAERAALAAELRALAEAEGMPQYLWVCEFVDSCVAAVRNDPAGVRRHATAGAAHAAAYRLSEPEAAHLASLAMLDQISGELDAAEARYADVTARMHRNHMLHADSFEEINRILLGLESGELAGAHAAARARHARLGPSGGDLLALVLARDGRPREAREISRDPAIRPDKLFVLHATLRGDLVVELGLRDQAADAVRLLLPFADQVAGASTGVHAAHPVAQTLGGLHRLLGDEHAAAHAFAQAEAVAELWDAPRWAAAAKAAR